MKLSDDKKLNITCIGGELVCVKGVGKMFFEQGFPISMAVDILAKGGIRVSILHVADECLKNGWAAETVIKKFREDFKDGGEGNELDVELLSKFCYSTYEDQRDMIFESLFKTTTNYVRFAQHTKASTNQTDAPVNWLRQILLFDIISQKTK